MNKKYYVISLIIGLYGGTASRSNLASLKLRIPPLTLNITGTLSSAPSVRERALSTCLLIHFVAIQDSSYVSRIYSSLRNLIYSRRCSIEFLFNHTWFAVNYIFTQDYREIDNTLIC